MFLVCVSVSTHVWLTVRLSDEMCPQVSVLGRHFPYNFIC